jgi:radial spoke head protein 4/6
MTEQIDETPNDSILSSDNSLNIENKYSVSGLQKETENYPTNWNFSMKVPDSQYHSPVEIPTEEAGYGVNRLVYLVLTDLSGDWTELPPVTPHQINVSRRIKKYQTGDLDENIFSYPVFPGTERNFLRAIIARISSSTCIAPRNFFQIEGDEEDFDAEDDEERSTGKFKLFQECLYFGSVKNYSF